MYKNIVHSLTKCIFIKYKLYNILQKLFSTEVIPFWCLGFGEKLIFTTSFFTIFVSKYWHKKLSSSLEKLIALKFAIYFTHKNLAIHEEEGLRNQFFF